MLNQGRVRKQLRQFDFETLFIEELGWDHHSETDELVIENASFFLSAVAEKRGMVVLVCRPDHDQSLPIYATRRKIERKVAKTRHEHLIIYIDNEQTSQVWQWVRREAGKPDACREHTYHKEQSGLALIQKLEQLAVSLEEEERITLVDVSGRAVAAFNVEKITKKFYDKFKKEHTAFLKFIEGIDQQGDREWYASMMLNRLMFIYFIQKKGFLDGDTNYLRNRLQALQEQSGEGSFHSFYRHFLLRLFHEGLGKKTDDRQPELDHLLGTVPYLNGGLFDVHELEKEYDYIQITDTAFEKLFDFFEQYHWHLDERSVRHDNEINPDVLGYIFEKFINQKQMGAYYTKEDITEYISKNTIIPYLFDAAQKKCKIAFEGEHSVWQLLKNDPDRYIYDAVRKGCDFPLPNDIAVGLNDISKRTKWNTPAAEEFALPTEGWREVVARRERYKEVRGKLENCELQSINDLITYNLNIRQFAQDVIESCEGPELLRAIWQAIVGRIPHKANEPLQHGITILDPTCGSGAFLFAALNVLEPLYEACLDRMKVFVSELEHSKEKSHSEKYIDFRRELERVAIHANQKYFVMKSIILNNLYGVDIMPEAVEICKLRLFLKLVAQVERVANVEPLPDIDFNIRCGNTLVGFVSQDEVRNAIMLSGGGQIALPGISGQIMKTIDQKAQDLQQAFNLFRRCQVEGDGSVPHKDKQELRLRLSALEEDLNQGLAMKYGINALSDKKKYQQWLGSHQPFHWFIEYYGIMAAGGFDVIIGNPPYVVYNSSSFNYKIKGYSTVTCKDLYAFVTERSFDLTKTGDWIGLILPISIFGVDGFQPLQKVTLKSLSSLWISTYANRPAQIFDGAQKRLTILIGQRGNGNNTNIFTSRYFRWRKEERDTLLQGLLEYVERTSKYLIFTASIEKFGSSLEASAFSKIVAQKYSIANTLESGGRHRLYYTRKFGYFLAFLDRIPRITEIDSGVDRVPSELKFLEFDSQNVLYSIISILSSSTFFWFWNVLSDCRNLNRRDLLAFPLCPDILDKTVLNGLALLGENYLTKLKNTSNYMTKSGLYIETFDYKDCKFQLDEIDRNLAQYYGFTDEELDFIINYDIKYRMGIR